MRWLSLFLETNKVETRSRHCQTNSHSEAHSQKLAMGEGRFRGLGAEHPVLEKFASFFAKIT